MAPSPITPHPYNGLNYGHGLYGVDSIGTVAPVTLVDDIQCPAGDSGVLDELFCFAKRFFSNLKLHVNTQKRHVQA